MIIQTSLLALSLGMLIVQPVIGMALIIWISFPKTYSMINAITVLTNNLLLSKHRVKPESIEKILQCQYLHFKSIPHTILLYFFFIYSQYNFTIDVSIRTLTIIFVIVNTVFLLAWNFVSDRVFHTSIIQNIIKYIPLAITLLTAIYLPVTFTVSLLPYTAATTLLLSLELASLKVLNIVKRYTVPHIYLKLIMLIIFTTLFVFSVKF